MSIHYAIKDDCQPAVCTIVVIDVIRAFTTAAFAGSAQDTTGSDGEDRDCAEYIAGLLGSAMPAVAIRLETRLNTWLTRIRADVTAGGITSKIGVGFEADLDCCLSLDRSNFVMPAQRWDELLVMQAVC